MGTEALEGHMSRLNLQMDQYGLKYQKATGEIHDPLIWSTQRAFYKGQKQTKKIEIV